MSEWGFRAGEFPWVWRLTQRKFNSFIVNVMPMTNEDERALSIARPNVGMWLDKLRRAGHVVLVHQYRLWEEPATEMQLYQAASTRSSNALNAAIPSATSQSEREPVTDLSAPLGIFEICVGNGTGHRRAAQSSALAT